MEEKDKSNHLLKGSLLFKNVILDGVSKVVPIIVAILFIPILISELGDSKFGLLSIVWVIMSFAHMLDFGLSRAIIKFVSEKIGRNQDDEIVGVFGLSWLFMFLFALILCASIIINKTIIVQSILSIESSLVREAELALVYTAIASPFVFSNSVFISVLKAYQEFFFITIVNTINSIFNYLAPIIMLLFTDDFSIIILAIVSLKLLAFSGYLSFLIVKRAWIFRVNFRYMKTQFLPVLKFGGWVSVSNLINPILVYSDRFLIASIISIAAVTYYVTPMDMVVKIGALTIPVVAVLFPAISNAQANDKKKIPKILKTGITSITLFSFPIFFLLGLFSFEILELWIGTELAIRSDLVLKILAAGVILKSLASMPYSYLHGSNKPEVVAKIHLVELPIYLTIVYLGLTYYGIIGAAIAYFLRNLLDYILLSINADRMIKGERIFVQYFIDVFILFIIFSAVFVIDAILIRAGIFIVLIPIYLIVMWRFRFTNEMKNIVQQLSNSIRKQKA